MVLYIDETEHFGYFIVAGLLAKSEQDVQLAYKKFKKKVSNYPLSNKLKEKVFLEFKSTILDGQFQKIKENMLLEINSLDGAIIYSFYVKKHKEMKQVLKESVYITLLSNIINSIEESVDIVFDKFNNKEFEESIISAFSDFSIVHSIVPMDSQTSSGLQFVDNICSVIRLHLTNQDEENYFEIIKEKVIGV